MNAIIPSSNDLVAIIERNFESKGLDYKGPMSWSSSDKPTNCALVKDFIAMANTGGGYVVVGVSETAEGFSLDGLSEEQALTFDPTKLCQFLQSYADPPINLHVHKIQHRQKLFVVIQVPKFPDTPHICQKDFPGILRDREIYVRTDNNETAPIKSSADFRNLIEIAMRNRTDSLLSSVRAVLVGSNSAAKPQNPTDEERFNSQVDTARNSFASQDPLKEKHYVLFTEIIFRPQDFDEYRFGANQLEQAVSSATSDFFGWPFLYYYPSRRDLFFVKDDGLETLVQWQDFAGADVLDYWRMFESGLFYTRQLTPQSASDPPVAHAGYIVTLCTEALYTLTRLYQRLLADSDSVSIGITIHGTRRRSLVWPEARWAHIGKYTANVPEVTIQKTYILAEWRAGLEDLAVEMAISVCKPFRLTNPDATKIRKQVQQVLSVAS